MATHRAIDVARQLKDDIKNSMRISSRSKERTALDAQSTNTNSGRSYFEITNSCFKKSSALSHRMHILNNLYVYSFRFNNVKLIMFSDLFTC